MKKMNNGHFEDILAKNVEIIAQKLEKKRKLLNEFCRRGILIRLYCVNQPTPFVIS